MKLPHGQSFSSEFCDICHACCGSHRTVSVRTPESTRTLDPHAWALCKCLPIACCRAGQCCVSPARAIYEGFQIACCRAGPRCGFRQGMRDCVLSCMLQRDALLAGGCHMVVTVYKLQRRDGLPAKPEEGSPTVTPTLLLPVLPGWHQAGCDAGWLRAASFTGARSYLLKDWLCDHSPLLRLACHGPSCPSRATGRPAIWISISCLLLLQSPPPCCCGLSAASLLQQKDTLPMSSCHLHLQGLRCWHCQKRHNCSLQGSTQLMPAVLRGRGLAALTALLTSDDPVSAAVATTKTALSMLAPQVGSVALTGWPCVPLPVTVACEAAISPAYCSDCEAEICLCDLL